ncbi:YceI family protein [Spirosoma humi]
MKPLTILIVAFAVVLMLSTSVQAQPQSFTIDPTASQLTWTGYAEVGSWAPTGTLRLAKGQVTRTGNQITSAIMTMDMTSIRHENERLQTHLRDEALFDAAHFPTATFVLRSLSGTTATGQLTLKGITKLVSFPVSVSPDGTSLRIKGRALIDRTQFGIRYNSTSFFTDLGDQAIKNEFALQFDVLAKPIKLAKGSATRS